MYYTRVSYNVTLYIILTLKYKSKFLEVIQITMNIQSKQINIYLQN